MVVGGRWYVVGGKEGYAISSVGDSCFFLCRLAVEQNVKDLKRRSCYNLTIKETEIRRKERAF